GPEATGQASSSTRDRPASRNSEANTGPGVTSSSRTSPAGTFVQGSECGETGAKTEPTTTRSPATSLTPTAVTEASSSRGAPRGTNSVAIRRTRTRDTASPRSAARSTPVVTARVETAAARNASASAAGKSLV